MRQKIFAGSKIRHLREANSLNQGAFAERLGISPSYLNQIENNQRPLTAPVLLALAQTFSLDIGAKTTLFIKDYSDLILTIGTTILF